MPRRYRYFVYIVMNQSGTTIYTGITNNILRRGTEHAAGDGSGFSSRYHTTRLVYFEVHTDVRDALAREKQIKGWRREKKETLIRSINPRLEDLFDEALRVMQEL
ncbi:MAG: GIY-YIG nuclease family protein [Thermoanaerobaculia bacterium]|jgi:putative endonuclease